MIEYLVMDVDGTLTDGKIYMSNDGEIMKAFNSKDGVGIHDILIPSGIRPVIITGRVSGIVMNRCRELNITEVYQGVKDKIEQLKKITYDLSCVAYIGDDVNDLICMQSVKEAGGIVGCPADASREVKEIADFISQRNGGDGAVRDFIERIINKLPTKI